MTPEDPQMQTSIPKKTSTVKPKKQKVNVDSALQHPTVLSDYKEIDTVVIKLYDMFTRDPSVLVQIQIDRYLFAASAEFVAECGGDMRTCILHACQVPSIYNLPDIIYILRQRLIRGSWQNSIQETVCRYTIPGMQKSRWVARQRKVPSPLNNNVADSNAAYTSNVDPGDVKLVSVYINTMLGLLLGLYPKCSKRPGFTMRVRIVRAVRAILTSSIAIQSAFVLEHISLIRLSMVEYFSNVIEQFCPVEYNLLNRHVDFDAYVNLCRSSCDLFRVNNLSFGIQDQMQNQPLDWKRLDQLAYKITDKIIRSTRVETKLVNYLPQHHKSIKRLVTSEVYKNRESCDKFLALVKNCHVACWHEDHSYLYQKMITDLRLSDAEPMETPLETNIIISDIHSIIRVTMLPRNFIMAQIKKLREIFQHDRVPFLSATKRRLCLGCILKIASKQLELEQKIK